MRIPYGLNHTARHQPHSPLPGGVQLHGDDVLQLLQRLFDHVLHGVSHIVGAELCACPARAELQAIVDPASVSDCVGLLSGNRNDIDEYPAHIRGVAAGGKYSYRTHTQRRSKSL